MASQTQEAHANSSAEHVGVSSATRKQPPFYRLKTPPETILLTLKVLAEGLDIQATARVFEVKVHTVQRWLEYASGHMDTVSAYLMRELQVSQVQLDEMWLLLGK